MFVDRYEGAAEHPVLAIHGNAASNAWWEPVVRALPPGDAPWISAEWRGCGRTPLEREDDLTLEKLAADYVELAHAHELRDVTLVGHSTGCLIALAAMALAPELFRGAVLLDPVGADGLPFPADLRERFLAIGRDPVLCESVILATIRAGLAPELRARVVADAVGASPLLWSAVPRLLHEARLSPILPGIRQPVLVLHGEHDTLLPIASARALAGALPRGMFLELAGRGNSTNLEDPALFARLLTRFQNETGSEKSGDAQPNWNQRAD
jgi:pimeloyl-ACP methyl ester carboxylesterase